MDFSNQLEAKGFQIVPDGIAPAELSAYQNAVEAALENNDAQARAPGLRNVFERVAAAREFAVSLALRRIVEPILGPDYFAVRALIFDKTSNGATGANWKVPYHQDLSIAVKEKSKAAGFTAWSLKAGVLHVQPPMEILENMLTVRLHLDNCNAENGALRVLPGSHRLGRLDAKAIQELRQSQSEKVCVLPAGGVLLMRPLLLHASSPAQTSRRRRVLHLEFACEELPHGLKWHWRH